MNIFEKFVKLNKKINRNNYYKYLKIIYDKFYKYMKSRKFEKLLFIELFDELKVDFENKYDVFIKIIYLKSPKISEKNNFNFNFNYNSNF